MNRYAVRGLVFLCLLLGASSALGQQKKTSNSPQITAKFGKGVVLTAADSSFNMKINFRMQNLATYSRRLDDLSLPGESAFMIRRSRIKAEGFMFSPKLKYKTELGLSNRDFESTQRGEDVDNPGPILDMVIKWQFAPGFELWFGQTKLPGNRERLVSSGNLQFVDRSLINSRFTTDRDAGFWLVHQMGERFIVRNTIALTSGEGKNRSVAKNPNTKANGLAYSYRLEILPFGAFSKKGNYTEGDLQREAKPKLAIAGAFSYNDNAVRSQGQLGNYFHNGETRDLKTLFVDYIFKYKGFSSMGEFAILDADNPISIEQENITASPVYAFKGMGYNFQTSYLFANNFEIAGRFSRAVPHADITDLKKTQTDFTLGLSRYIVGHKLKAQADLTHSTSGTKQSLIGRFQVEVQF